MVYQRSVAGGIAIRVFVNEGKRWAGRRVLYAKEAAKCLHQGGFAGAEVAVQRDFPAAAEGIGEGGHGGVEGGGGIEKKFHFLHALGLFMWQLYRN